ncbi:hypothetical protein [Fictibacillus sp. S7]|uniref:hypothetical protein n=1 Tax=Fictibacillus sp. S7 TaxID=2212476 RepID=UPI001F519883|nr:hypothetical protein [Fictibacillus sp. S7]
MSKKGTCFVIMGYGIKTDLATGRDLNLDKTYKNIIKPAAEEVGLECIRADEVKHSGTIDVPMYEHLINADVVIADLSTNNSNAFYELGVRHALRPRTTIAIAENKLKPPFDINHTVIRQYEHLGTDIGFDEVHRFRQELIDTMKTILDKEDVDSPVYTHIEEQDQNVVMNRSIEFPPEYYQAGLGILSYFHKLLKEKYPGVNATVRIIQDGLVVKMIVETKDGDKHIVEKALEEYDLILKGETRPEEYFGASAQIQILELKNELRMAQVRIESQKELLAFKQTQLKEQQIQTSKLVEIISNGLSKPALSEVHIAPVIKIDNILNQQSIIHNEVNEALQSIRNLKQIVDSPETVEMLNDVEGALSETNADNINDSKGVSKLKIFLEKVNNTEGTVSKAISTTTAGLDLIKKLARNYNKLAPWCGLPSIPFVK